MHTVQNIGLTTVITKSVIMTIVPNTRHMVIAIASLFANMPASTAILLLLAGLDFE